MCVKVSPGLSYVFNPSGPNGAIIFLLCGLTVQQTGGEAVSSHRGDSVLERAGSYISSLHDRGKDFVDDVRYKIDFVRRTDLRNLKMLPRSLSILAQPSIEDYRYNSDVVLDAGAVFLEKALRNPERLDDFQMHSPEDGYTSTPEDGILAGFTEEGRMSSLFYPHTGFTQQMPYFVTGEERITGFTWRDGPGPLKLPTLEYEETVLEGSDPREGGFLGVRQDDVSWLWEDEFDHELDYHEGTGILDLVYERDDLLIEEDAYVLPGEETVVRDFIIQNRSDEPVESAVYYMQANVNDNRQYSIWNSDLNRAVAGDELVWEQLEEESEGDPYSLVLATDGEVARSGVAETELEGLFASAADEEEGRYIGGFLEVPLDLEPGEEAELSFFLSGGAVDEDVMEDDRFREAMDWWGEAWEMETQDVDDPHEEQLIRSLSALMMLSDPDSGSLSAAPNLQPSYYPSWIRDASFSAVALARGGREEQAKRFLSSFCPQVQEEDGSFCQCYDSQGGNAGIIDVENDQQPLYMWGVREVYDATGDDAFLEDAWSAVEAAAEYCLDARVDNGLLAATPDFAEMPTDSRQSLWTNVSAYQGVLDAAYLAEEVGKEGERYREAAREIGEAVDELFIEDGELYTHYTIDGIQKNENQAFAIAVAPSDWASDFGREELVLEEIDRFYEESDGYWLPREFIYATALYREGYEERGDEVVEEMLAHTTPSGNLAEQVETDGRQTFASLGWSQAGFLLSMDEKYEGL